MHAINPSEQGQGGIPEESDIFWQSRREFVESKGKGNKRAMVLRNYTLKCIFLSKTFLETRAGGGLKRDSRNLLDIILHC